MMKRILFPTDGSKSSEHAIEYLKDFAQKFDSEVVVLNCYEATPFSYTPKPDVGEDLLDDFLCDTCKVILKDTVQSIQENTELIVRGILEKGNPGPTIITVAEREGCDLIVMGSRGLGPVKSMLLGSKSNYVVHHSKIPVLLIN